MQDHSGMACRMHWLHHMSPMVNRGPWTDDEDTHILLAVEDTVRYVI